MFRDRRNQIIDIITREFIGPDPIDYPGMRQGNGEEILTSDPPLIRYAAGILYPRKTSYSDIEHFNNEDFEETDVNIIVDGDESNMTSTSGEELTVAKNEYLEDAEELLNLSNAFRQSAISLTVSLKEAVPVDVKVYAGIYTEVKVKDPETGISRTHYYRKQLEWNKDSLFLSDEKQGIIKEPVIIDDKETGLQFDVTYRDRREGKHLYTFTLENIKEYDGHTINNEDCFFQVRFVIKSTRGFCALPDNIKLFSDDEDYLSNQLLYRNIKNYAIGHGCAAAWKETDKGVFEISTSIFPQYEIKPIVPSRIDGVSLEMYKMSDYGNMEETITELKILCNKYQEWIEGLKKEAKTLKEPYKSTAERHIRNCEECLNRMIEGVNLLEDPHIQKAFCYMNRAMLLQQLHYNLPLQKWVDDGNGYIKIDNPVRLPDIHDDSTWYGDKTRYGKWRPFQLAFILINIKSISDPLCPERKYVDLIWFPTGGGKTEAYLGLSAFTIFLRRLKNRDDTGTAIIMRYTLRLLTAQQYERAAAMICACETIRKEKESELGKARISIGLWVGGTTTPNHMNDAVRAYDRIKSVNGEYPFVIRRCPWCGAQIGAVPRSTGRGTVYEVPGLEKSRIGRGYNISFKCGNSEYGCDFSRDPLPLYVVDDDIYEKTPTLVLGTVDKFAMLPYIPEAQRIFGFYNGKKITAPDLIIQDELHLISGPLGSMVGHYETMINELCSVYIDSRKIQPKIITSTATISRAKEQCHALYNCGCENVKQFPPPGLETGNSFFAIEDKTKNGRMYVGILAAGASSVATTMIRLYATLLYAASALDVKDETERDPYWTHIGYFNSIRELGQVSTWIRADIDEYLHVIYKRRREDKKPGYKEYRRYIRRDEELTSRIKSEKVTAILNDLNIAYPPVRDESGKYKAVPIDICLATNMISVGLDVPRLGLMSVAGQPKTTSEYIQATSRVGRSGENAPGIILTIYNPGRPRDKSHYEQFIYYHSRIYCNVEPTSVTPFSSPLRDRALHAIIIGIIRLEADESFNSDPPKYPSEEVIKRIKNIIRERVESIDPEETENCMRHVDDIFENWKTWGPQLLKYHDFNCGESLPLMYPFGSLRNVDWGMRSFPTPTSMRSVDASCEVKVLENQHFWGE